MELINFPKGKLINDMKFGAEGVSDHIAFWSALHWWMYVKPLQKKKKRRVSKKRKRKSKKKKKA